MKTFRLLLCLLVAILTGNHVQSAEYKRTEDLIYGRKCGTALTLDVFQPTKTNGLGIIFVVSGGWFSSHEAISPGSFMPLLDHGYVVFAVVHGSQPKFTIPEIEQDLHRAVRYIKANASKFGINPSKLGITGASAGGHLSLTMAAKGAPGKKNSRDAVEKESSEIQCVACFFPPTDFLNYSKEGESALGEGTLKTFKPAFGPRIEIPEQREALGKEVSPIYHIKSNMAPILIAHGDADKLVPIYQAERFIRRCQELGVEAKLITRPGEFHGWRGMTQDMELFAQWFDEHLRDEGATRKAAGN